MFTASLKKEVAPIIDSIYNDGFIQGMINGDLDKDAVIHYLKADHHYLNEFAKIYSLLIPKINDKETIKFFLEQIDFVMNGEVAAHYTLADYAEVDYKTIIKLGEWYPSSDHYIKHMYFNAYRYSDAAYTICAMAPCPYVYQELALKVKAHHDLIGNPFKAWFDFYAVEMKPLMAILDRFVDEFAQSANEEARIILANNFKESCIHEKRFFNMAFNQETWESVVE
ncbi:thiaminase II [Macrococcoides caseolyticum]|uniref:thiaminase II n=1 Tax=Macrococcoides caseolyticum TaxID=69966 RepID=UPI001F33F0B5|nr:thiaminase II [Macrococcus caseolyticus]MCE4957608.1 thiaminase II [Macrococcus caseolyticus]